MSVSSERIPLCASANEESDSSVNNTPLTQVGPGQIRLGRKSKKTFGPEGWAHHENSTVPLKRAAGYLVGKAQSCIAISKTNTLTNQSSWTAISLATQCREKHYGIGGSDWQSHREIWIDSAEFDSPERWRSGVLRSGEKMSIFSLRSRNMDLGNQMKVEIQSDSSTSNSLTDRLGAGPLTKHIDTRYFGSTRTNRTQFHEGSHSEIVHRCWNEASPCFRYCNNIASLQDWFSTDHGSYAELQEDGTLVESSRRRRCRTENRNRQLPDLVVNIETGAKAEWNHWVGGRVDHFSRWMDHDGRRRRRRRREASYVQRVTKWTLTDRILTILETAHDSLMTDLIRTYLGYQGSSTALPLAGTWPHVQRSTTVVVSLWPRPCKRGTNAVQMKHERTSSRFGESKGCCISDVWDEVFMRFGGFCLGSLLTRPHPLPPSSARQRTEGTRLQSTAWTGNPGGDELRAVADLYGGRIVWTAHLTRHIFSHLHAHILMSHRHWLKFGMQRTFHSIPSSCAHDVVVLTLRDFSTFLSLLSIFSPIVLFILLVFTFFFHDVEDKYLAHSGEWGPWHPCRVRPSHKLWAQRLAHLRDHRTIHPGVLRREQVPKLAWSWVRWLHHRHSALLTTVHPGARRCSEP